MKIDSHPKGARAPIAALAFIAVTIVTATAAASQTIPFSSPQTVSSVGYHFQNGFFRLTSGTPAACAFGNLYVSTNNGTLNEAHVTRIMNAVTTAYLSGRPLKRVDYTTTTSGGHTFCYVDYVEF